LKRNQAEGESAASERGLCRPTRAYTTRTRACPRMLGPERAHRACAMMIFPLGTCSRRASTRCRSATASSTRSASPR
jgi:hypothetical protein